jgi:hypothetical protein
MMLDSSFESKVLTDTEDPELNKQIHEFWAWVLTNLPDKLHMLKAPIPRTVINAFDKSEKLDKAMEKYNQSQAQPTQPTQAEQPEKQTEQSKE